ncbi:MAG TPA: response regulator transcription factor [Bryobacteraceae bacterium]|nr:response regulator transcription factor [Bryobacteraceae bacterium]
MPDEITVILVDDHSLVRKGFRRMLEDEADISVVGEAGSGREALEVAGRLKPRVVVMDMSMPEMDGVEATRELRKVLPGAAVLILSMYSQENYVRRAFEAGAQGYILKNADEVDLGAAIRDIAAGKRVIDPGIEAAARETDADSLERLTPRERQILQLIAEGNSNKEIAAMLTLSVNTVCVHRANLMDRLGVHRTAELVLYAIRKGLVRVP